MAKRINLKSSGVELDARVAALESDVQHLSGAVEVLSVKIDRISTAINGLVERFAGSKTTNWGVLVATAALVVSVSAATAGGLMFVGNMALSPVMADLKIAEAKTTALHKEFESHRGQLAHAGAIERMESMRVDRKSVV